jgi:hypothetical protein
VTEGVEVQEQISFEENVVLHTLLSFEGNVFYKEGVEIIFLINSIKEGIVNYKREFSLSSANFAWAYSM